VRIEIGEIESVIRAADGIKNVYVQVRADGDQKRVVAYCATGPARAVSEAALREHCRRRLVSTMRPSSFVIMDELPINASGKIDEKALPAPGVRRRIHTLGTAQRHRTNDADRGVRADPRRVDFSKTASFFDLGGTSLQAVQLMSKIKKLFSTTISLVVFFNDSSVQKHGPGGRAFPTGQLVRRGT